MDGLSGIASGVDTSAIVEKLMAIERQGRSRSALRKSMLQVADTGLKDVQTRATNVKSAAAALRAVSLWADVQTADSSDPAKIGVSRTSGAGPGGYTIDVTRLARAEQRTFDYAASGSASTITVGGVSIDIAANATLTDVTSAINNTNGSPIYATAVGNQVVLSARTTGAASAFAAVGSTLAEDPAKLRAGLDAQYTIDGGAVKTSATNAVEDAVPGLKLSFKTLGSSTITVGAPGLDTAAIKDKLKTFVEAYNSLVSNVRSRVAEKTVAGATTAAEAAKGVFFGDSAMNSMLSRLRTSMTDTVTGNAASMDEMRELGITTGGGANGASSVDSIAGKLVIDDAKLTSALTGDPLAVKKLLGAVTGVDGFAQRIERVVDSVAGTDGTIGNRIKANAKEITRTQARMDQVDRRLVATEKRLKAQFAAMESALNQSQTQQSWLSGQIRSLG